jgi:predicted component of type VI protein secretion system
MSLLEDLHDAPEHYTLFAALRRIEQAHRDRPRLGESRKAPMLPPSIPAIPRYRESSNTGSVCLGRTAHCRCT